MADWREAVSDAPGGVRLLLEVSAGAKAAVFPDGFNPWREGRIGIRVRAPAQDGRANEEVIKAIATFFKHPTARIHIESGQTDSRKAIRVMGLQHDAATAALAASLDQQGKT